MIFIGKVIKASKHWKVPSLLSIYFDITFYDYKIANVN